MTRPGRCLWCDTPLDPTPGKRDDRRYCGPAHAAAYKRAKKAETLADLVERLGPFVMDDGLWIYKELVDHLAGRVQERV
jgi:hypothetical protein